MQKTIALENFSIRVIRSQGIGANICHTPAFTQEEEDKLWATKVMNTSNPKALQRAVFIYQKALLH